MNENRAYREMLNYAEFTGTVEGLLDLWNLGLIESEKVKSRITEALAALQRKNDRCEFAKSEPQQ